MKRGPRKTRTRGELDKSIESTYSTAPGAVTTYKLPPEEIDKIFKNVSPVEVPNFLQYMLLPKEGI